MLLVSASIIIVLPLAFVILQVDWLVMNGRESTLEVLLIPRVVGVVVMPVSSWKNRVFMEILDISILHCIPAVVQSMRLLYFHGIFTI